ncbi:HAMP domain-containing histidine kinase [Mucilaginibacter sp. JRF]|uniref:sensor histidine kinase n=1 Tax=Mucilaginibacter sp. JRF TaxID=2780088 RepID=UPI00187FCDA8|nr:HAMP domain-containing sensor histidine kinase [Mucilaginibacter sp. JRF]MBE9583788.1 HAMP domain-containing histidine kinase [Mucilaginibacter sp. JRF]
MKLVDKLTLWLVVVLFLATPLSMVISYNSIRGNIYNSEVERMTDVNDKVAQQLKAGQPPHRYMLDRPIAINKVRSMPAQATKTTKFCFYNKHLKRDETRLDVASFYKINNDVYRVSTYNYIAPGELIISGMLKALFWKMLLITACVALTGRLISKLVLSSFQKTLHNIQNFSLHQKEKLEFANTNTKEFKELNFFLKKMTDKAIEDYGHMKEFSENASHEVQTPLAVIHSKLELLADTPINENQALLINDMQNAIDKLVKINRSLLLLCKLDNQEYETQENVRFCTITNSVISQYENWIQLKNLSVTKNVDKRVYVQIHPVLAEILVSNLLSNAIRYNIDNGDLSITLTKNSLTVSNTGLPPEAEPEELFQRFKKSNQSADSIGLGLSIVKQICAVNNLDVTYTYLDGIHTLHVVFAEPSMVIEEQSTETEIVFDKNTAIA